MIVLLDIKEHEAKELMKEMRNTYALEQKYATTTQTDPKAYAKDLPTT